MQISKTFFELLMQYDVPTPRYTSYPTVPYWDNASFSEEAWNGEVSHLYIVGSKLSLRKMILAWNQNIYPIFSLKVY